MNQSIPVSGVSCQLYFFSEIGHTIIMCTYVIQLHRYLYNVISVRTKAESWSAIAPTGNLRFHIKNELYSL